MTTGKTTSRSSHPQEHPEARQQRERDRTESGRDEHREAIRKLGMMIHGIEIAMFTTLDDRGNLHSRPMATQQFEFDGNLWFLTGSSTAKSHQIEKDQRVNVCYADPGQHRYVSVSGIAEVLHDPDKIRELWSPLHRAWFPRGQEDPDLRLIRVRVEDAEYWDVPSTRMVHLFGFIKSSITGERPRDIGDHGKLDLTG